MYVLHVYVNASAIPRYIGEELLACSGELCEVLVCDLQEDCGVSDSSQLRAGSAVGCMHLPPKGHCRGCNFKSRVLLSKYL